MSSVISREATPLFCHPGERGHGRVENTEPLRARLPMPTAARWTTVCVVIDERLTEREEAAARLLAYGHTNRDVARELNVSIRTAESERARLMRKLGFARRAELVRWALERGLLR
jgi:DNA-binding NarL/FixJ family response regulator